MKSVALHNRLISILLKRFTILLFFTFSFQLHAQDVVDETRQKEGRKIFKSQCASCHKLDKKLIGPALGKVEERRENDWLKAWIKDNVAFQKIDADAREAAEFSSTAMTAFPQLTDQNIDDILYYTTVGEIKKVVDASGSEGTNPEPASKWLIYILALAIIVAFLIIASLLKQIAELKGGPKTASTRENLNELWEGFQRNTFLKVLLVIFGLLITAYVLFGTLFKIGVDEGYMPLQEIAFSHKIHAGDNKIDCQYCHSSAKHSKTSGIPTVNVCMNCHLNISEVAEDTKVEWNGETYNKEQLDKEIAKIYEAAGWDVETLEYTGKTKPIKWIRVHNLPDFVYFNHSQHVTVAGLKCQKCHGPVEEMDEMYQHSPLTMGWCIDCHKETKVDVKGNEYYQKIHEDLAKQYNVDQVTVAQLGGKECGKCH
ncbi:MAG: c-type cytochrome, partial [Polaribacter sp.]